MPRSNINITRNKGFQSLLYVNFIVKKKYRVEVIAQIMGYHKDTLYKWIRGERPFPIDEVPNLVKSTGIQNILNISAISVVSHLCLR